VGEKFAERMRGKVVLRANDDHAEGFVFAEFHHHLTAHTAWVCEPRLAVLGPARDGDRQKLPLPLRHALNNAVRSAQFVGENAADSMLQPVKIFPLFVRIAAPTRNFEYGEYDIFFASSAAFDNSEKSMKTTFHTNSILNHG
jgi:hypothetical protein